MWKVSVTLWLAVIILLGWTVFNAAQAAPDQRLTQRTDAHYRGSGHHPPPDYGYGVGRHPRPYPHRHYVPIRRHHPYPGYYAPYGHDRRPHPVHWLFLPPPPPPIYFYRGY